MDEEPRRGPDYGIHEEALVYHLLPRFKSSPNSSPPSTSLSPTPLCATKSPFELQTPPSSRSKTASRASKNQPKERWMNK